MSTLALAAAGALPWVVTPLVVLLRARRTRSLDEFPPDPPRDAPLVSVIIPARDEARNIERCVRSVLATTWPSLEVIVVDDHSRDDTGPIARGIAAGDPRLSVLVAPPLSEGWFGKQWACATGARAARGAILLFTDADTVHAPDLLARSVRALEARDADLFSVAGRQEMRSFWEHVVQPQMFALLAARYGGSEHVEQSTHVEDKIANGQCLFVRRSAYDALGGHALVKDRVAEDLALAQRFFAAGCRVGMAAGLDQLSTRMYASLGELVRGWGKNVYAGGREAMRGGRVGRMLFPVVLPLAPLFLLAPVLAMVISVAGAVSPTIAIWGALGTGVTAAWWAAVHVQARTSPLYALAFPLGAAVVLWIIVGAIARGDRVSWKGRVYRAA